MNLKLPGLIISIVTLFIMMILTITEKAGNEGNITIEQVTAVAVRVLPVRVPNVVNM